MLRKFTTLTGRDATVLYAQVIARTPICVCLPRGLREVHRVRAIHYTLRGVCIRVEPADCPEMSRIVLMFHPKLPPELGE